MGSSKLAVEITDDNMAKKKHRAHDHHAQEENINIRAAVVHVIGDMLQSIGVIIAAVLIYFYPEAKIADPICTYLFSILVIFTTVPVFRDCIHVLMESRPKGVDTEHIKSKILEIPEVQRIDDMHCWALAGNKNVMIVHVRLFPDEASNKVNRVQKVYTLIKLIVSKEDVCHFTAQIL